VSTPAPDGRVVSINVSAGGVPKLPVDEARVAETGVQGDRQHERTVHGGPTRAVSLLAMETIERLAAEGHPIEPGSAGENLTTWGIEIGRLAPGTRLLIGADPDAVVELELNVPANPCKTIRASFIGGRFLRLSPREHPGDTRVYAWVRRPGTIRANDPIRVLPPAADSEGAAFPTINAYEDLEAGSTLALWQATQAAGYAMRVVDDGELLMGSCDALPGPAWNQVRGFDTLPTELPRMRRFASAAANPVVVHARSVPWPGAVPSDVQVLHAAAPDGVARVKIAGDVTIREATPADAAAAIEILIAASAIEEPAATAWRAIARVPPRHGSHRLVAEVDGRLAATATVRVRGETGLLRGAAVLPEFRGRGLQMALTAARAALAGEHGVELLVVTAAPGSHSEQNLRRSGFEPVAEIAAYSLR
jgi:MOSC domain-containing protein YiiM/N-acetylglutamate synthase-like GNAT family acetyltransferase